MDQVLPDWGQAIGGGIKQGVSSGLDTYMQAIQNRRQQQMQNLQFVGQTGYNPDQLMQSLDLYQQFVAQSQGKIKQQSQLGQAQIESEQALANMRNRVGSPEKLPDIYTDPQGNKFYALPDEKGGFKYVPVASTKGASSGLSADKFVQEEMDKANRAVNPLNAMRGTALGTAGIMKTRISTARDNLNDPTMTPQQLASTGNDLAGIVQMGAPTDLGIKDQNYQTWWTKASKLAGEIRNKPSEAGSPETVKKLKDILSGYDKVYNSLINTNLKAHKASVRTLLNKYPDFNKAYSDLEKQITSQYPLNSVDYSSPEAMNIKAQYKANKITLEQANQMLDQLGQ